MKTIKQQIQNEINKIHSAYGYDQKLRDEIKARQRQAEKWELEDAIADFKNKFNPYTNEKHL